MQDGVGQIVNVQELSARGSGSPKLHNGIACLLCLVKTPDQGGHDVTVIRVIVVPWAIQVGRHGTVIEDAVLAAMVLAQLQPSNLCQCIGFVGGLKRT